MPPLPDTCGVQWFSILAAHGGESSGVDFVKPPHSGSTSRDGDFSGCGVEPKHLWELKGSPGDFNDRSGTQTSDLGPSSIL